jgi:acyl-coenzyme A synthetase/AMP-(fatty) acid ligase
MAAGSPALEAEPTCKDDSAFWLYSSGSTGFPKGCVHLHHDMVVATELYGRGVLDITERDRCYSVAKLFFAYGLGNALYFPFGVGASTVLFPGPPTPAQGVCVESHSMDQSAGVSGVGYRLVSIATRVPSLSGSSLPGRARGRGLR